MAKSIGQLNNEKNYKKIKGYINKPLNVEWFTVDEVKQFKVDEIYQRDLSPKKLNNYGILDFHLLIPALLSERPEKLGEYSGKYVLDGQHKANKYVDSEYDGKGFCGMVLTHDENATLEEVREAEAIAYLAVNTQRKQLTQVDKLRANLAVGDETALRVYNLLTEMNYHSDDFGSLDDGRKEIQSFSQFYYTIDADYPKTNPVKAESADFDLLRAYRFFEKIYDTSKKVHGVTFRGIALTYRFGTEGLTNGRQEHFLNFCIEVLPTLLSQDELQKGISGFDAPRWILHKIIKEYNDYNNRVEVKGKNIKDDTILNAVNNSGEKRFYHPTVWNKSDKKSTNK